MAEGHNFWKNKLQDRNQLTEKLSNRKPNTRTQMTRRLKWQKDPKDRKTQVEKRPKLQEDTNDKKTYVTRRVSGRKANWQNTNWQNANW